jgi:mono/diheme cytochrome c family protein
VLAGSSTPEQSGAGFSGQTRETRHRRDFYPPNLTGDVETGLGGWSAAEIVAAVRTGVRPDGRTLAPVMPYHAYGMLTDDDAGALAAYLKSLAPIRNKAPDPAGPGAAAPAPYLTLKVPGTG